MADKDLVSEAEALIKDLARGDGTSTIWDARAMICRLLDELNPPDTFVRYCPACGRVGEVPPDKWRCCESNDGHYVHPDIASQASGHRAQNPCTECGAVHAPGQNTLCAQ